MADEPDSGDFVCPNCNAPVEEDWAACPSCGIDFAGAEEEAPAPPPPPQAPAAPPTPPASAAPPRAATPPPPAKAAPPPPSKAAKAPPPPKAAKPPAPAKDKKPRPAGGGSGVPIIGPLIRRFGIVGFLGLGLAIFALIGYFVVMNYDTLLGGQSINNIGENQKGAMNIALMVFAAGAVVTVIGLFRARSVEMTPEAGGELAEAPVPSPMESAGLGDVMAPLPPVVEEVRAPPARAPPPAAPALTRAPPPSARAPPPAPKPAVAAAPEIEEEEEEEEVALDIPTTTRPPVAEVSVPASSAAAAASIGTSDELEDLFGELESEVQAAAAEEDVLYECPNCHGMVKEDDTSCPHCKVTFEG